MYTHRPCDPTPCLYLSSGYVLSLPPFLPISLSCAPPLVCGCVRALSQVANDAALSRVDKLEQLLTNQLMRLAVELFQQSHT